MTELKMSESISVAVPRRPTRLTESWEFLPTTLAAIEKAAETG